MTESDKRGLSVVDSSGWIEYFTESPNADAFAKPIEKTDQLIVPSLSILEVFKWVLREGGEDAALKAAALMQQGNVIPLDAPLALRAAKLGIEHQLPLADSVIYATAQSYNAILWTQDADFDDLSGVRYQAKSFS